ncbi:DEKNAAC100429 [Brettanomyces naardenensis]|uniref:DEKNAAC100429 n=1 Tax=Brettanomyces naardenensis TaxID=13370 RepID=A0A448YFE0_BRENA|nr:DEKNAAC100429 [Brettanomyces naardenensis]
MAPPIIKKRNRKYIVCANCRRRKTKCDRRYPCSHCTKAGIKCVYKLKDGTSLDEVNILDLTRDITSKEGSPRADAQSQSNARGCTSPILDIKLPKVKRSIIFSKPSMTVFIGSTSWIWLVLSRPSFKNLFSGIDSTMHKQKKEFQDNHKSISHRLTVIDSDPEQLAIIQLTEDIICPNYYQFQERLVYFQNNLNGLLYSNFVPMDVVHSLFLSYFTVNDGTDTPSTASSASLPADSAGSGRLSKFLPPKKPYLYSDISLITAIVSLSVIFTRYAANSPFHYQLTVPADELISLSLKLLNASNFRRKKTYQGLLSLILLRSCLFVFDNIEGCHQEFESYPMLQTCIDYCYQMGLHTDPDITETFLFKDQLIMKTRSMPNSGRIELWNYLQTQDAYHSIAIGTPILIHYEFCAKFKRKSDSFFETTREEAVMIMRKLSFVINSLRTVSIREILNLISQVIGFCYRIPAAKFLLPGIPLVGIDLDEVAYLFKLKLLTLQNVPSLCSMIMTGISSLHQSNPELLKNMETMNLLNGLSKEMYRQSILSIAISLHHIRYICEGRSVFGPEKNGKYVVYFRDLFATSLGQSFLTWFIFLLPRATKNPELIGELQNETMLFSYPPEDNGYPNNIDLVVLEKAFFHDFNGQSVNLGEQLCTKLMSSSELTTFASSFHEALRDNMIMKSSIDSYLIVKSIVVWPYIIGTIEECKASLDSRQMTVRDVIKIARTKVEKEFNEGGVNDSGDQLERMFDSLFADQDWLNVDEIDNVFEKNPLAELNGDGDASEKAWVVDGAN